MLSCVVRIPGLYYASYWWRAVQTESTAYWFGKVGINLLNYQTPLYGPPWQIPFEFPLFQAIAAVISKMGIGDLVFACRLTALLSFYLSALFLYLVCKEIFMDNRTNFAIITIYLWLPYNIYYSLEPLIDYLALALALAYLFFILSWLKTGSSNWNALFATIFGSLSVLVKPTTAPIVVIPIITFVVKDIVAIYRRNFTQALNLRFVLSKILDLRGYWLALVLMATVPLLAGSFWTRYSDQVKNSSIFTQWLTSPALVTWNFGTWELRSDLSIWIAYAIVAQRFLLPYGLVCFGILGLYIAIKERIKFGNTNERISLFIISIGASSLLVFVVFINLYRHEYYYIALSASLAIMAGYGIRRFWQTSQEPPRILGFVFVLFTIVFLIFNIKDYIMFRDIAISDTQKMQQSITWAREVQQYVLADDWVAFVESDWDPTYVYSLERKIMVVTPRELEKPLCQLLSNEHFSLVVVGDLSYSRNEQLLTNTFKCFKSSVEVMPGVYQVQH